MIDDLDFVLRQPFYPIGSVLPLNQKILSSFFFCREVERLGHVQSLIPLITKTPFVVFINVKQSDLYRVLRWVNDVYPVSNGTLLRQFKS
jgi:hypothetical protein